MKNKAKEFENLYQEILRIQHLLTNDATVQRIASTPRGEARRKLAGNSTAMAYLRSWNVLREIQTKLIGKANKIRLALPFASTKPLSGFIQTLKNISSWRC